MLENPPEADKRRKSPLEAGFRFPQVAFIGLSASGGLFRRVNKTMNLK
jgi:hypothetical protein